MWVSFKYHQRVKPNFFRVKSDLGDSIKIWSRKTTAKLFYAMITTHLTYICSKTTIEAFRKGVNMFKVNNKDTTKMSMKLMSLLLPLNTLLQIWVCYPIGYIEAFIPVSSKTYFHTIELVRATKYWSQIFNKICKKTLDQVGKCILSQSRYFKFQHIFRTAPTQVYKADTNVYRPKKIRAATLYT